MRPGYYARLYGDFRDHPKILSLSDAAFRVHVEMMSYCAHHLTDGRFPEAAVRRRIGLAQIIEELVGAGLWMPLASARAKMYAINDWLLHNPSRDEIMTISAKRKAAGRAGGLAKARAKAQASGSSKTLAKEKDSKKKEKTGFLPSAETLSSPVGSDGKGDVVQRVERAEKAEKAEGVQEVVDYYRTLHTRARPGKKERRLIAERLKEGYSVQDLKDAIDGNHRSPHHCGENDRGTRYHSLELIVRDSKHVSDFISIPAHTPSPRFRRNSRAAQTWLEMQKKVQGLVDDDRRREE